jgi:hypothetical protein
MHLINCKIKGINIPDTLPDTLLPSKPAASTPAPATTTTTVPTIEKPQKPKSNYDINLSDMLASTTVSSPAPTEFGTAPSVATSVPTPVQSSPTLSTTGFGTGTGTGTTASTSLGIGVVSGVSGITPCHD